MVNLKALEAAINRVENVRRHEFTFEVEGQEITLRILRPDEEAEVQKYAQVALENVESADQGSYMDLMNRMRHATLGFAIIRLGELDLRNVEYIETGEHDDHGNPISMPKWEAIANLVREWGQHMLSEISQRYGDLVDRAEIHAAKAVKYDSVDLDSEIQRVESRLKDLRSARTKRDGKVAGGPVAQERSEAPRRARPEQQAPQQQAPQQQAPQQQAPQQQAQGRPSAIPQAGVPRERQPQQAAPEPAQEPEKQQYVDERGIMLPDGGDSFFDPSDPAQAMEVESRRQAMLRQQHIARQRAQEQQEQMRREMGMPSEQELRAQMAEGQRQANRPNAVDLSGPNMGGAVDSVRQAANLHNAVADNRQSAVQPGRPQRAQPQPQPRGQPAQLHGKPVYKMPAQTLERPEKGRQHGDPAQGPMQMNPQAGGRNPNFRPKGS
jgi:hypothetical protein